MHSKWLGRILFGSLVVGVSGSSGAMVGCVGERDPINRVQAGVVAKSFFLGPDLEDYKDDPEFRTKSYNIDSPANTESFSGTIGGASAIERVRWEVTENYLLGRRSYQESPGADAHGLPRKEVSPGKWEFPSKADGTIIAAYKIESHFDIRRAYNSQTGEESNVIEENTSDRPWNKREYMRIDWSKNEAESTSGDISWVFGEGSSVTAVQYSSSNESEKEEDRPHFELENGYFDITNKYQLKPEAMPGWGVPECVILGFFNGGTTFDCTPTEVKARTSYVRLTGNEDFEPFEESNAPRDIVGNWGNAGNTFNREYGGPPRTSWDPQYGFTDAQTKTFYSIHNIWEKSHQQVACNNNTDEDKDGTADACSNDVTKYKGATGSQCDTIIGKCTIPVRDRPIKTMGYWLNIDAPQDLTDEVSADGKTVVKTGPIEEMTVTWNQLIKTAAATRREVECRRTHEGSRDECHALYFEGTGPDTTQMVAFGGWAIQKTKEQEVDKKDIDGKKVAQEAVVTCHNPVREYDPSMCGKKGEIIRLGDMRKNYAIYWPYASRAPYGGVATIGGDPLTGEMLGVTATIMMRSASYAAAQQRDILQLAMGDIKLEDLIEGVQPSRYADLVKDGKLIDTGNGSFSKAKTPEQLQSAIDNIDHANVAATLGVSKQVQNAKPVAQRSFENAMLKKSMSNSTLSIAKAEQDYQAQMSKLNGTELKSAVANRGLLRLVAESQNKNTGVYQAIKAFSDLDPGQIQNIMDSYASYLGNKGICFADGFQNAAAGSIYQPQLANYFKKLYGGLDVKTKGEKIYKDLLRESLKGIAFHEIGHSLGLRHNFASSWDALNYPPQYWQLRTNEGQSVAECTGPRQTGGADSCMGPRYLDPTTEDEEGLGSESRPGIEYFSNTSTMEYQIERFGETSGAGSYDLHAMETLYGRSLQTIDNAAVKPDDQQYFALLTLSQGIPDDLIYDQAKGYGVHYTKAALKGGIFDPKRDCRDATDEEKESAKWRIVHGKVCQVPPKDHLAYQDMESSEISFKVSGQVAKIGVNGVRWRGKDENGKDRIRWSYRYGEDYSRGGYMHAKPFDSGADVYEITMNVIRRYDVTYPWSYFRRQNKEFAWWSLPNTAANNTFARMRSYHWNTTVNIGRASDADLKDDDKDRPSVVASAEMFNFLQRVMLTPEPGSYGPGQATVSRTRPGGPTIFDVQTDSEAGGTTTSPIGALGIIDSRYVQVDFDNDKGGSWDYFWFPKHTGFDEEKVLALRELVDSRPTLSTISRDNALDGRDPYISFRTDVPHATDRLLGALMSEDWEMLGPSMSADGNQAITFPIVEKDPAKLVRPAGSKGILFPNAGYQNELGSGIYAMIFSRFSTDMVMANKMRVRLEGDAGATIPDDRKAAFTDPVSGQRYLASRFGTETINGRAVETGIASRMIDHANDLVRRAFQVKPTPNAFGEYEPILTNGVPTAINTADGVKAQAALRRYIGFLDAMRQVGNIFGGGPLGGGGGGGGDD